jgi:flagellum-specific peptidoglycan hydrolase FlgJ
MSNKADFWAVDQPAHVVHFIQMHAASAKLVAARTGVPAEVILAQSALESDWGRVVKGNDYFGIKRRTQLQNPESSSIPQPAAKGTTAASSKAPAYSGYAEAAGDYASFLLSEFSTALPYRANPEEFAEMVASRGYSTDPQYASKMCSIILLNVLPMLAFLSGR